MLHRLQLQGQGGQVLKKLPATYKIVGSRFEGAILVLGACVMGIEPAYLLMGDPSLIGFGLPGLLFVALCVALALIGIDQFFVDGTVSVTDKEVVFSKKSLLFRKEWREPVSAYVGIRTRLSGKDEGGDTIINKWQVWLFHRKRGRRIKLVETSTAQFLDEDAEEYCRLFGLPRIE